MSLSVALVLCRCCRVSLPLELLCVVFGVGAVMTVVFKLVVLGWVALCCVVALGRACDRGSNRQGGGNHPGGPGEAIMGNILRRPQRWWRQC